MKEQPSYKELMARVKAFTFDVDGVFTDNSVILMPGQQPMRLMNVKDGYAVQHTVKVGYKIAIITGGKSEAVRERFAGLGIQDIYLGASQKLEIFEEFMELYDLKPEEILHMGDDLPDYEIMSRVLLPVCPADAAEEIKNISLYVSPFKGGHGCVRDVLEQVLKVQGKWYNPDDHHQTKDALSW
ncbi:MAG: HAD hydrolase family protein [Flavobacteriales bacterium]|nr:HAD hydrolase family protein [Flavobacteriales bacterium]